MIPFHDLRWFSRCLLIISLSCLFLHFIRRFWNHMRTCDSDNSSRLASSRLSCLLMYLWAKNSTSSCLLWKSENTALFGGITFACFTNFCWLPSTCSLLAVRSKIGTFTLLALVFMLKLLVEQLHISLLLFSSLSLNIVATALLHAITAVLVELVSWNWWLELWRKYASYLAKSLHSSGLRASSRCH